MDLSVNPNQCCAYTPPFNATLYVFNPLPVPNCLPQACPPPFVHCPAPASPTDCFRCCSPQIECNGGCTSEPICCPVGQTVCQVNGKPVCQNECCDTGYIYDNSTGTCVIPPCPGNQQHCPGDLFGCHDCCGDNYICPIDKKCHTH